MIFRAKKNYITITGLISIILLVLINSTYADDLKELSTKAPASIPDTKVAGSSIPNELDTDWKITHRNDDVTHYSKPIAGTPLTAYKGVCIVDSSVKTILSILMNVSAHSKWVKYCSESKTLKKTSENDAIQYYNFDIPWPFENRDIVIKSVLKADWNKGKITITGSALKEPIVPVKKTHLRITDSNQKWIIEKITHDKTLVTFLSSTSIKGSVPGMFNKLLSNIIPSSTLISLKTEATEAYDASQPTYVADSEPKKETETELF